MVHTATTYIPTIFFQVWEESEMWKQRKLEMEAEDKKSDRRTDKRRKENAPSQKSGEYVSGYWNKKLMELKEKDTSRSVEESAIGSWLTA